MDAGECHFDPRALRDAAQDTAQPAKVPAATTMTDRFAVPEIVTGGTRDIFHDL
jgi:hypothetical protein